MPLVGANAQAVVADGIARLAVACHHVIQLFTGKAAAMPGRLCQQLADVGPALGIEREADFFRSVAQYEGKKFTGIN